MLVFANANLVFFAVPKTGSTAYHLALKGQADIVLAGRASIKHMTARKYDRHLAPYLKAAHGLTPERLAVIRDPVEQLRSWYKYRCRPNPKGEPSVVSRLSFDDFITAVISKRPPDYARVGDQRTFVSSGKGELRVDHLIAYERPTVLRQFLADRLGKPVKTKPHNVSPDIPAPLSADVEAALRHARAPEFELHQRIMEAGGHLVTPLGK